MKQFCNLVYIGVLCLFFIDCSKFTAEEYIPKKEMYLDAYIDKNDSATKTQLNERGTYYNVCWSADDCIAVFPDDNNDFAKFSLISGVNSQSGKFKGFLEQSDTYVAIYPHKIVKGRAGNEIKVSIPNSYTHRVSNIPNNSMPMCAYGKLGSLNFKNLGAVLKVQLSGTAVVKSITLTSNDNKVIAGEGTLDITKQEDPLIVLDKGGYTSITLNCGGIILTPTKSQEFYFVIPYGTYDNGFRLLIDTYNDQIEKQINKSITFERSQMRAISTITIDGKMLSPEERTDSQLWYKSSDGTICAIANESAFNANIVANTYGGGWGIIVFDTPPTRVSKSIFAKPQIITELYLPDAIEQIGDRACWNLGVKQINFPKSLRIIGTDAFMSCKKVEEIIIPEGVTTLKFGCFDNCQLLMYITFPSSLVAMGDIFYGGETRCLSLFKGNSKFISSDGRSLFSNLNFYTGIISDQLHGLCRVAGRGLKTYTVPEQVVGIHSYAFSGCTQLNTLYIHKNVKSMGTNPFPVTYSFRYIYVDAIVPPTLRLSTDKRSANYWNEEIVKLKAVYVPKESVSAYENAEGWSVLKKHIKPME